ncbi:MAG: polymorphic toxin type 44 domain-containing protein [Candidatus Azobacteroides sp.]|nr:polymorphic toxin type 44 domain-containing protein [Candidatus Azobacteroides sp.]
MQFKQGHGINYTYDASGTKRVVDTYTAKEGVTVPPGTTETVSVLYHSGQDYCGNVVYFGSGTGVSRLYTPEGYINRQYGVTGNRVYYYTLKDHLGSMRYEFKGDGTNVGYTHYYPSGIEFTDPGTNSQTLQSKERYNGKELQSDFGLNMLDYWKRNLDASRFQWTTMDPLAEKYPWLSPYAYCGNNPLKCIDPNGMDIYFFDAKTGEYTNQKYETTEAYRIGVRNVDDEGNIHIKFYDLADPKNDSEGIDDGYITHVEILSNENVESIIREEGGFNKFNGNPFSFGAKSSGYGSFDYSAGGGMKKYMTNKGEADKVNTSLYVAEGDQYAHNAMNFGNFLWGATGYTLGYSEKDLLKAADLNSRYNPGRRNGYEGQPDSADDQLSISRGAKYSQSNKYRNKTYWFFP